ncbi:hypothetical protein HK102_008701 [Quaeritorhiza haematococci]|nr:hypothetical protein HK102_008701 [Quaeritorhiza haematococci]
MEVEGGEGATDGESGVKKAEGEGGEEQPSTVGTPFNSNDENENDQSSNKEVEGTEDGEARASVTSTTTSGVNVNGAETEDVPGSVSVSASMSTSTSGEATPAESVEEVKTPALGLEPLKVTVETTQPTSPQKSVSPQHANPSPTRQSPIRTSPLHPPSPAKASSPTKPTISPTKPTISPTKPAISPTKPTISPTLPGSPTRHHPPNESTSEGAATVEPKHGGGKRPAESPPPVGSPIAKRHATDGAAFSPAVDVGSGNGEKMEDTPMDTPLSTGEVGSVESGEVGGGGDDVGMSEAV